MRKTLVVTMLLVGGLSGCSTWDNLSTREKSAAVGAGVGGVAGAAVTNGSILGTAGGAVVGGIVGNEVGKRRD